MSPKLDLLATLERIPTTPNVTHSFSSFVNYDSQTDLNITRSLRAQNTNSVTSILFHLRFVCVK